MKRLRRGGTWVVLLTIAVGVLVSASAVHSQWATQWTTPAWQETTAATRIPQAWGRLVAMTTSGQPGTYLLTFEDGRGIIRTLPYAPDPSTPDHLRLSVFVIERY